jgi:hypothetical protein
MIAWALDRSGTVWSNQIIKPVGFTTGYGLIENIKK